MKAITVAEESRRVFADLKLSVKLGKKNIMPYLSGTQIKKTKMYKEVKRYREDAEIDYELGVIKKDEYETEIEAVRMFEKALANYSIF